jgi:HSP20 family molecular chaperone IbpA
MAYFYYFDKTYYEKNQKKVNNFSNRRYQTIEKEDKKILVYDIVGINESDIKIEFTREDDVDYLQINGKSKNDALDCEFEINARFAVDVDKIEKIGHTVENGLLYITSYLKQVEKPNIKIFKE